MKTPATYDTSSNDAAVARHFAEAMFSFHSYLGDPVAHIDAALAKDPDFVMGHLFRAVALTMTSERQYLPAARTNLVAAESLARRANPREQALTQAIQPLIAGDWDGACQRLDQVLVEHPTDAFALQTGHLLDFYRGDALNLRNRVARVLPQWSAGMPGYSFVLGMHAFGLEECNQYADAEHSGRRAVDMEPRDAWAVHAVAHVMEMQGRVNDGIEWLERRQEDWAPSQGAGNGFAYHNFWHLALFHLDRGDAERALALLDERIAPDVSELSIGLVDVTAMLWRLHVLGVPLQQRLHDAAAHWKAKLNAEGGYYGFNDFHAALAFAGAGDGEALTAVKQAAAQAAESGTGIGATSASVGLPLIEALEHYAAGRYARAAEGIAAVRDVANRFGGSHAQRDLLTLTLIDAARRADNPALARHYLNERLVSKPASGLGWRLQAALT